MDIEYPLPEWAEAHNHQRERVIGAQLMTKDGTRMGNAVITEIVWGGEFGYILTCRTDAGNTFRHTLSELNAQFTVGPYIVKTSELLARKIVIQSCSGCPHQDHRGAFGNPSYVPTCRHPLVRDAEYQSPDLPYTTSVGDNGRVHACPTHVIPEWCPLEHNR